VHTKPHPAYAHGRTFQPPARARVPRQGSVKLAAGETRRSHDFFFGSFPWTFRVKESPSKIAQLPRFDGRTFKGGPAATIVSGKIVHRS